MASSSDGTPVRFVFLSLKWLRLAKPLIDAFYIERWISASRGDVW
jgi:hypothetical protein